MTLGARLLGFIDERLQQMLDAPEMWGSNESVELQILQLLEIRLLVVTAPTRPLHGREVQLDYERFLADHFAGAPPITLSALLGPERQAEIFPLLAEFVAAQGAKYPASITAAQRNADELRAVEWIFEVARSSLEREQQRRDTFGDRPVKVTDEDAA
jgi:hypothetical protein